MVADQKAADHKLLPAEDKIRALVDKLEPLERAVLYKYLYTLGYRMQTIEAEIQRLGRR